MHSQSLDLVSMNASEDDKIKAMMDQSTKDFDLSRYVCCLLSTRSFCYLCDTGYFREHFTCQLWLSLANIVVKVRVIFSG